MMITEQEKNADEIGAHVENKGRTEEQKKSRNKSKSKKRTRR